MRGWRKGGREAYFLLRREIMPQPRDAAQRYKVARTRDEGEHQGEDLGRMGTWSVVAHAVNSSAWVRGRRR